MSENISIINNAKLQIEEFYKEWDTEVNHKEEKARDLEIGCLCFCNVADLFKDIKSRTMIDKYSSNQYCGMDEFKDNYADFIEKLWNDLEIDKEKCECLTCVTNQNDWRNCAKIVKQRKMGSPIRTCPICQKEMPKEEYERPTGRKCEGAMIYYNFHLDAHLDPYGGRGARYLEKLMKE